MRPPPEPDPRDVEYLTREIGLFLSKIEPTPGAVVQLVAFGTLFNALCREVDADRDRMIRYLDDRYTMTLGPVEEALAAKRREGN